ncbi:hypothetical protein HOLleu_06533 [Holothuria leucospilota]|uniref:Uncharacterized protein n=1 Tax=Holothuria leucospilota TaxID=206669 RepID=A0A9Q1CM90_HOLLE|nr:hypothetical protein HOLleu_06533 [Holothuria leucospilota]
MNYVSYIYFSNTSFLKPNFRKADTIGRNGNYALGTLELSKTIVKRTLSRLNWLESIPEIQIRQNMQTLP